MVYWVKRPDYTVPGCVQIIEFEENDFRVMGLWDSLSEAEKISIRNADWKREQQKTQPESFWKEQFSKAPEKIQTVLRSEYWAEQLQTIYAMQMV